MTTHDNDKAHDAAERKPIDANALERMAKERPDECFLKGSGVLKLIGAIRQLEREVRLATSQAAPAQPQEAGRAGFEAWARGHGGLPLAPVGSGGGTRGGMFPATYWDDRAEIAWRAWANKPAQAAPALPDDEPYAWVVESRIKPREVIFSYQQNAKRRIAEYGMATGFAAYEITPLFKRPAPSAPAQEQK